MKAGYKPVHGCHHTLLLVRTLAGRLIPPTEAHTPYHRVSVKIIKFNTIE